MYLGPIRSMEREYLASHILSGLQYLDFKQGFDPNRSRLRKHLEFLDDLDIEHLQDIGDHVQRIESGLPVFLPKNLDIIKSNLNNYDSRLIVDTLADVNSASLTGIVQTSKFLEDCYMGLTKLLKVDKINRISV